MSGSTSVSLRADDVVFQDGLGKRRRVADPSSQRVVEVLYLRSALRAVPSFEFALQEAVGHLTELKDERFARILGVSRLSAGAAPLALVSDCSPGVRLAEVLELAEQRQLGVDIDAALSLIRQLAAAVAVLHQQPHGIVHGAIAPERLVVSPTGRLVVVEHALAPALEQLPYSRERMWTELRVALPPSTSLPRFDQRADIAQVALVAIALILGRQLRDEEYPSRVSELHAAAWGLLADAGLGVLAAGPRSWLARALQTDEQNAFVSGFEAWADLEWTLGGIRRAVPDTAEPLVARFYACADGDPVQTPRELATKPAFEALAVRPQPAPPSSSALEPRRPKPAIELVGRTKPAGIDRDRQPAAIVPLHRAAPSVLTLTDPVEDLPSRPWWRQFAVAALVALGAAIAVGVFGVRRYSASSGSAAGEGTLLVNTSPPGVQLIVDGSDRGVTPASLSLRAGAHLLELRNAGKPRVFPVTVRAGSEMTQYIELPKSPSSRGELEVRTDPPGARITLDGLALGTSPMMLDLSAGEHTILLKNSFASATQSVTVKPGASSSLLVRLGAAAMPGGSPSAATVTAGNGWISVSAPLAVRIFESGRLLGESDSGQLAMPPGRHDIEIVNDVIGYRASRTVQIAPGQIVPVQVEFPKGTIALNAVPWAEVWIDGQKAGDTPIGNLALPIGPHEIVFKHPELGQQLQVVSLKANAPIRLTADLRKK